MVPSARTGTVMYTKWNYDGPGKMSFSLEFYSYYQMGEIEQEIWLGLNEICMFMCILDIGLLLRQILQKWSERRSWYRRVRERGIRAESSVDNRCIRENLPVIEMWDLFDIGLRSLFIWFLREHMEHYKSLNLDRGQGID